MECLGYYRDDKYFDDINALLTSNPRNTLRNEKFWEKLIVIIFENCSYNVEEVEMEIEDDGGEVSIDDLKAESTLVKDDTVTKNLE